MERKRDNENLTAHCCGNRNHRSRLGSFAHSQHQDIRLQSESVFFISLHKCATTCFNHYVLDHCRNLTHIDYAKALLENPVQKIDFWPTGYVYGVIRLSAHEKGPVYDRLVRKIMDDSEFYDQKIVFMIRDPRDILISFYYSLYNTHRVSGMEMLGDLILEARRRKANVSLDQFAISNASWIAEKFGWIEKLMRFNRRHILLRYRDLIENFDRFYTELNSFLPLASDVEKELFLQTRPRIKEKLEHKRSGKTNQYKSKLKKSTIGALNEILKPVLDRFGY